MALRKYRILILATSLVGDFALAALGFALVFFGFAAFGGDFAAVFLGFAPAAAFGVVVLGLAAAAFDLGAADEVLVADAPAFFAAVSD